MSLQPGDRVTVDIERVAHGGHMVARHEGQVIFVRHALPGEQVVVLVTELDRRFARADAVEVLRASPDRVVAPCPVSGAGGCGGCDFQHVSLPAQRELKATVVAEQLRRLAGIEREVVVEAVPGDRDGLRWRTRMQYVALPDGHRGLRRHRSHEVVRVDDCLIQHPDARVSVAGESADDRARDRAAGGETVVEEVVTDHGTARFEVAADGFWQVHPGAPRVLVETVVSMLQLAPGERVFDLYAGVGLFSVFAARAVGDSGQVTAVESDRTAARFATRNLADFPAASVRTGRVDRVLRDLSGPVDAVILDPPRSGAKRAVVEAVVRLEPRAVAYVACDPAALARDLAYFAEHGYHLTTLRALDLFPMTNHVECVALLVKTGSDLP